MMTTTMVMTIYDEAMVGMILTNTMKIGGGGGGNGGDDDDDDHNW